MIFFIKKKLKNKFPINSVFVLGSTSTIAKEICKELALKGCNEFFLLARDQDKNNIFAKTLETNFNVKAKTMVVDLNKNTELNEELKKDIYSYDLYLLAAGYLGDSKLAKNNLEESQKIINVNFYSLLPWLIEITSQKRINSSGRLWVLSSVAGDKGKPSNYQYGAAKSALTIFCEGILLRCVRKPFLVRIIKAGYVKSPMTKDLGSNLLCTNASYMAKKLLRNPNKRGIHYFPWWWKLIMLFIKLLPNSIIANL